ncbi:MAG: polysaccharide biosynthesis/export family protein [Chthoniobacteraceae bacterium]
MYFFVGLLLACPLIAAEDPAKALTLDKPSNSSSASTVGQTTSMDVLNDAIKLGIGDRVSFRIVEDRREVIGLIVTESGEMEVPLIGRVLAVNKTCKQLAREIKPLLEKEYFHQATVIVGLDSLGTKSRGKVYLTGQIRAQGGMDIQPDEVLTVSKAILKAGGTADFADRKKVKLIRKKAGDPNATTTTVINLIEILDKGHIEKDVVLEPGDLIVVPERLINF